MFVICLLCIVHCSSCVAHVCCVKDSNRTFKKHTCTSLQLCMLTACYVFLMFAHVLLIFTICCSLLIMCCSCLRNVAHCLLCVIHVFKSFTAHHVWHGLVCCSVLIMCCSYLLCVARCSLCMCFSCMLYVCCSLLIRCCLCLLHVAHCWLPVTHVCYVVLTTHYVWVSHVSCMLLTAYGLLISFMWLRAQHILFIFSVSVINSIYILVFTLFLF